MFKRICVALDNSRYSDGCCDAAVSLATTFGAEIVGSHVYAASMHEARFRQMEPTLPANYRGNGALERSRTLHNSLIPHGLHLISSCYLEPLEQRCLQADVPFTAKTLHGKNWEQLVEDIRASDYDLVIMGARGHGASRPDVVGSVCLRVLRRMRTDALVVKDPAPFREVAGGPILVALDGSQEASGALEVALALGKAYGRPVEAVASYDPYFHRAVFQSMVQMLSQEANRVFRFQEQERLHDEIIDGGLGQLYQTYLNTAQQQARSCGVDLHTTLLTGRAADALLAHAEKREPWLLMLGRIGFHSREDMDIGSVTEHLLRFAPCNLYLSSRRVSPIL